MGSPSAGGNDWVLLRDHANDASLAGVRMSVAAWPVDAEGQAFRRFKIHQTGVNVSGGNLLMCAGIELYGELEAY